MRWMTKWSGFAVSALACMVLGFHVASLAQAGTHKQNNAEIKNMTESIQDKRVMVIGGSSARGFRDPNLDSYICRAFHTFGQASNTSYRIFDHAFYGGEAVEVPSSRFESWLDSDHPQVVVISWGMLNDIHHNTPMDAFNDAIHNEIQQSLNAGAAVLVVTPPPVEASTDHVNRHMKFGQYLSGEQETAASFHNPYVFWFDLNRDMLTYLSVRHENVSSFCADSWHPNQAGHQLGGLLLSRELIATFGDKPIPTPQ
jgi:hypothetical protein